MRLVLFFILCTSVVHAVESQRELPMKLVQKEVKKLEGYGSLDLYLYQEQLPLADHEIIVREGSSYQTDRKGHLFLYLPEGEHKIQINEKVSFNVRVESGEATQAIVTLTEEAYALDYFAPEQKKSALNEATDPASLTVMRGKLVSAADGKPIPDARVFVRGTIIEARTNSEGEYELAVPRDEAFDLSFLHRRFSTLTQREVKATESTLVTELSPSSLELSEFVVVAPHVSGSLGALIEIRKNASNVADVLGAEQISKAGDSDAAASLKRVTGLTLVDGKFIYIRGLGERYSQTLLNGSTLPSPDPTRRVVPLDMFPSGIIENLVIQKSYTPDLPGEFAGGAILLETKSIPDKFFFKISTSYRYGPDDTGAEKLSYAGGQNDWTGRDDGTRALSAPLAAAIQGNRRLGECNLVLTTNCFTTDELTEISKSVKRNSQVINKSEDAPPSLSLSIGDRWSFGSIQAGLLSSLRYSQDWTTESRVKRSYNLGNTQTGELVEDKSFVRESSQREIDLGGTLDFGVRIGDRHALNLSGQLMRKTNDETQVSTGTDSDQTNLVFRDTKLRWTERELRTLSLQGEHSLEFLGDLEIRWRATQSEATLSEPDQREYRYYSDGSGFQFETRGDGNRRIYSNLQDENEDYGVDLRLPFTVLSQGESFIKIGYHQVQKNRNSQIRRFKFEEQVSGSLNQDDLRLPIDQLFADENLGVNGFLLKEDTQPTDNYTASQEVNSGYAMIEYSALSWLKVISGARYERSFQDVRTFKLFDPDNAPDVAALETIDLLPVHSATVKIAPQMQVRLAYSETLSRPDFKELSTAPYHDVENDRIVVGNNNLVGSIIRNYDLRWEWYFAQAENVSLGVFAKEFQTPIEAVARNSTEGGVTFQNAESAENFGAEFEFRKKLGFIHDGLGRVSLAGNYSYIDSEVTIAPENAGLLTSRSRSLQGQSPYVINAQLLYENLDRGTNFALLYNVFGKRITEVGVLGLPDVYEDPFHQVDLVFSQKINSMLTVSLKGSNLLDPEAIQRQGDKVVQLYNKGRAFSLGLSGSF